MRISLDKTHISTKEGRVTELAPVALLSRLDTNRPTLPPKAILPDGRVFYISSEFTLTFS